MSRFLWLLLFCVCQCAYANSHILGTSGPPFMEGWVLETGACVGRSLGSDRICDYSVGIMRNGDFKLVYMGRAVPNAKAPGKGYWLIIDEMLHPPMAEKQELIFTLCRKRRQRDDTIFAVVEIVNGSGSERVSKAFRANLSTEKLESISSAGVTCSYAEMAF